MAPPKTHQLGELQLRILKILWERGEAAVTHVHEALGGQAKYAPTTISTMLRKMEARGLVAHREEGRMYLYRAQVAESEVSRNMADYLVEKVFQGSLIDAVNHLLTTREVSQQELTQLERLIEERKRKR